MDNESLAAAFKALGDPTRLRIYQAIKDKLGFEKSQNTYVVDGITENIT